MANQSIDPASIAALASAVATAIQRSGGTRSYNPVSNQVNKEGDSPAARAEAVRSYKLAQNNSLIMKELAKQQASTTKSIKDLDLMMQLNNKTLSKAINAYDNIEKAEKELVKALRQQLTESKLTAKQLDSLGGKIETLEDALKFHDMAKAIAELSKAMKETADGKGSAGKMLETLRAIQLGSKDGKLTGEFLALKKSIDDVLKGHGGKFDVASGRITKLNGKQMDVDKQEAALRALNDVVGKEIKNGKLLGDAKNIETLATQVQTAAIKSQTQTYNNLSSILTVARKRVDDWAVRVGSAATVIDKLAKATTYLYGNIKAAAGTGTQRTIGDVFGREKDAIMGGVKVETLQEVQTKYARNRTAQGRSAYDQTVMAGASDMFKVTGDKDKALQEFASSVNILGQIGVSQKEAAKTTTALVGTFNELQYATGMTAQEINAMNAELTAGSEFRQSMVGLDEKQRAAALANMDLMIKENTLRGISIEQSKQMIQAQKDMANPFSPKARMKNAARLQQLGGVLGMDLGDAAAQTRAGGAEKYRAQLKSQGMSDADINARLGKAQSSMQAAGTQVSANLARNDGLGFMTEAVGGKMPEMQSFFNGTFDQSGNKANEVIGTAAKDFKEGVDKFLGGAALKAADMGTHIWNNPLTSLLGSVGAYFGGRKLLSGALGGMGGGAAGGAGAAGAAGMSTAAKLGVKGLGIARGGIIGGVADMALSYAGDNQEQKGNLKTGGALKAAGSAAGWAGTGAAIGTMFAPGLGTVIGGALGGIAGAGYGIYDNWGNLTGSPESSGVSPNVNTSSASSGSSASAPSTSSSASPSSSTVTPGQDTQMATQSMLQQTNQFLSSILTALNTQTDQIVASSDKSVEMKRREIRTQKTFSADTTPASSTIG